MKSYDRHIVWLNYLDSELKRTEGRRVPLNSCVRSPSLEELTEACRRVQLDPQPDRATYPRSPERISGYVSVKKGGTKREMLAKIAKELSKVRGDRSDETRKV